MADQDVAEATAMMFKIGTGTFEVAKSALMAVISAAEIIRRNKNYQGQNQGLISKAKNLGKAAREHGNVALSTIQNSGDDVSVIDVNKKDLSAVKKQLKNYGVDFAYKKNGKNYEVLFKGKNADSIQRACTNVAKKMNILNDKEITKCKDKPIESLNQCVPPKPTNKRAVLPPNKLVANAKEELSKKAKQTKNKTIKNTPNLPNASPRKRR